MEKNRSVTRTSEAKLRDYLPQQVAYYPEDGTKKLVAPVFHKCQEVYENLWGWFFTHTYQPHLKVIRLDSSNMDQKGHKKGLVKRQESMDYLIRVHGTQEEPVECYGDRKSKIAIQPEERYHQVLFRGSLDLYLQALAQQRATKLLPRSRSILLQACDDLNQDPGNKVLQVEIMYRCLLETGFYPPLWVQEEFHYSSVVRHAEDRALLQILTEELKEIQDRHKRGFSPENNVKLLTLETQNKSAGEYIKQNALDNTEFQKMNRDIFNPKKNCPYTTDELLD